LTIDRRRACRGSSDSSRSGRRPVSSSSGRTGGFDALTSRLGQRLRATGVGRRRPGGGCRSRTCADHPEPATSAHPNDGAEGLHRNAPLSPTGRECLAGVGTRALLGHGRTSPVDDAHRVPKSAGPTSSASGSPRRRSSAQSRRSSHPQSHETNKHGGRAGRAPAASSSASPTCAAPSRRRSADCRN
jgi:hypothetical protein